MNDGDERTNLAEQVTCQVLVEREGEPNFRDGWEVKVKPIDAVDNEWDECSKPNEPLPQKQSEERLWFINAFRHLQRRVGEGKSQSVVIQPLSAQQDTDAEKRKEESQR